PGKVYGRAGLGHSRGHRFSNYGVAGDRVLVDKNIRSFRCADGEHGGYLVFRRIKWLFGKNQVDLVLGGGLRLAVKTRANRVSIERIKSDIATSAHGADDRQSHYHFHQRETPL